MGARRQSDERFLPRYVSVSTAFDGRLTTDGRVLEARVIDVGREGLGILASEPLAEGTVIDLELADRHVTLRVVYCMEDLIHRGFYRCGLHRVGSSDNLINLVAAAGFLERQ